MRRESAGLTLAVVGVVTLIFGLAYLDLRREQARALDEFTAEQAALSATLAATLSRRLDSVERDLGVLAALGDAAPPALPLLVDGKSAYHEVELLDADGQPRAEAHLGPEALDDDRKLAAVRAQLWAATPANGHVRVSDPLGVAPGRVRLFLRRDPHAAVALWADTDRFFDGVRQAAFEASPAPMSWIVMDEQRRTALFTIGGGGSDAGQPPSHTTAWQPASAPPELRSMLAAMAAGERGTRFLTRPSAAALGLERRAAMAGFAPVHRAGGAGHGDWSVAVVASAKAVRDRARFAVWRLGAATGLTALLVALFAVMVARQQRRTQALGTKLELAEATAALRERAETIVERIPVGVMTVDGDGQVRAVNPYLAERGARASGALVDALGGLMPDEQALLDELWTAARADRQPRERAGIRLHLGGTARDVDVFVVPLARPLPDADCFVVLHDRTALRQLERNLLRAEKLATIGTLSAGVAHEVGTPLGIISGRAEQLLARADDEGVKKGLSSILNQVDKMSTTIRQLLDFARARPVEVEAVSAAHALGQAAALLEHRFRQANVALSVDAAPSLPALAADRGQLEQVLVNLLINACDACAKGGTVVARARLSDKGDGEIVLEIADDGCGIPPEQLAAVFDPFFTTKKRGQGTGLGLSIAADIVKNHGGRLILDSQVGTGTIARVCWPQRHSEVDS